MKLIHSLIIGLVLVGCSTTDVRDVIEQNRDSVVCVQTRDTEQWYTCSTGFYIDSEGTLLTAEHVVEGDKPLLAIAAKGKDGVERNYSLSHAIPEREAAVLVPMDGKLETEPLTIASTFRVGDEVVVLGFPENIMSEGLLIAEQSHIMAETGYPNTLLDTNYIVMPMSSQTGSSGAPVLNQQGQVIGIINWLGDYFSYATDLTGYEPE